MSGKKFLNSSLACFIGALIIVLVFCLLDHFTSSGKFIPNYVKYVVVSGLIYSVASLGINFHSGYLGETSLGHAAFFGIGLLFAVLFGRRRMRFEAPFVFSPRRHILPEPFAVPHWM